jgi:hypothetical protein
MFCLSTRKEALSLINCVVQLYKLSNVRMYYKYDVFLLYYLNYSFCVRYILYFYKKFYWQYVFDVFGDVHDFQLGDQSLLRKVQYNLLYLLYPKLNFFSIFYNIRRKRKQRRSLYLVLAFDKHVCFKNVEREYNQLRFFYSKWE